jgi:hypothetical protein
MNSINSCIINFKLDMAHNKSLNLLLKSLRLDLETVSNNQQLKELLNKAKSFGRPLCFNNNANKFALVFGLCLLFLALFFYQLSLSDAELVGGILLGGCGIVMVVVSCFKLRLRDNVLSQIENSLIFKKVLHDNGMFEVVPPNDLINVLSDEFSEFRRGNYSRDVSVWATDADKTIKNFCVDYFGCHYVDKVSTTRTVTDSHGRISHKEEITYYHHNRHMMVIRAPFDICGLNVFSFQNGFKGERFRTISLDFNEKYKVLASSIAAAEYFLKPNILLAFLKIDGVLTKINFEISFNKGWLCLSFDDADVFHHNINSGVENPELFESELFNQNIHPHKLMQIRKFLEETVDSLSH